METKVIRIVKLSPRLEGSSSQSVVAFNYTTPVKTMCNVNHSRCVNFSIHRMKPPTQANLDNKPSSQTTLKQFKDDNKTIKKH